MHINVLYFASLREAIGCSNESLDLPEGAKTLADVREVLGQRHPALLSAKNLRAAINQKMAQGDSPVAEGDEVAFFPPVTGG